MKKLAIRSYLLAMRLLEGLGWQVRHMTAAGRRSGVRIHWLRDEPGMLRGAIKQFRLDGVPLRFFVDDDLDAVQSHHRAGGFYESEELAIIARHYAGGTFVDVGGNVGNHAVYAAKILNAARVIVFEPEPLAADICEINAALNRCEDRIHIHRVALSDAAGRARALHAEHNLGGTSLVPAQDGEIDLVRGDAVLHGEQIGFVKIDTEGFELKVLEGLVETIDRCRPPLFIEVENNNVEAFRAFCDAHGYAVAEEYRRYRVCTNFLAVPRNGGAIS